MSNAGHYTAPEIEYLTRVAGKVPVEAASAQLKRSKASVVNICHKMGISLRVPAWRMEKFWPEVLAKRKAEKAK